MKKVELHKATPLYLNVVAILPHIGDKTYFTPSLSKMLLGTAFLFTTMFMVL